MNSKIDNNYYRHREIGLYYSQWAVHYCKYNNNFNMFTNLITYIKENDKFNNVNLLNLHDFNNSKINVAFRNDIDCDIYTAKKMSKYYKDNKIIATFFLLHTSYYYRQNKKYPIDRCEDLSKNILDINNDYCSIGLHLDPLHVYINLGGNGTKEVENEINWLRKIVDIKSSCAHNCYYVFGAENFEIFKELSKRDSFIYKDKNIPLSTLSLKELGIVEINYPLIKNLNNFKLSDPSYPSWNKFETFNKAVHNNEIFDHNYDVNIWCVGRDEWLISDKVNKYFSINTYDKVISYLDDIKLNVRNIVFNLHPIYFSG